MKLHSIDTGYFKLDGGAMFGVVPKQIWNKLNPADENNLCTWAMRCLLVEDGNKLMLIDTGIGDKQDAKFFGHYHLHGNSNIDSALQKAGFRREDITDVFLTHLHFDHCGGSIRRQADGKLVPAFPNATYYSNERHWKWATQPNEREKASFLKENILPIQESGQLKLVPEGKSLNAEIDICYAYGHTDAMMLPRIRYKDKTVVFMADLLPSVAHIPLPYVMAYDMFPLTTLNEKKSFLTDALNNNEEILFFEHDPNNECCILEQTDRGIRAGEIFKLNEI
jgi:glyoxylase-like metal-dependent hydrolase (beta-lactamase superfamily II)